MHFLTMKPTLPHFVLSELGYLKTNPSGRVKSSNDMLEFDAVWWVCYLYRFN